MQQFLIIIEQIADSYIAHSPDFPDCVVIAPTRAEVAQKMHDAIERRANESILGVPTANYIPAICDYCRID